MMDKKLQDAFRQFQKRDVDTFPVIIISVNKTKGTCVVSDGQIEFKDVRLSSVIDGDHNKFFLVPAINSSVLVSPINEDVNKLYIEAYSEIESLQLKIGGVEFKINESGFLLKKQNESLKGLISDLLTAIEQMSFLVTTNSGTGSTNTLVNAAQFSGIKNRFNQFLNDV